MRFSRPFAPFVLSVVMCCLNGAASLPLCGQSPSAKTDRPTFEVASIKPNHSPDDKPLLSTKTGFTAINVPTRALIEFAYHLQDVRLAGGPPWVASARYDLDAKINESVIANMQKLAVDDRQDQLRQMVQSLLADRFKLKISHATRELPVFALIVAKNGLKLKPSDPVSAPGEGIAIGPPGRVLRMTGSGEIDGSHVPISDLAGILSVMPELVGRVVQDRTGVQGLYDFTLKWTPQVDGPSPNGNPSNSSDSSVPSLFTALQEQLGLKLESTKGPVDIVVIDHIEEPTPN